MKGFNYTICDEVGIHARPAAMLAKEAKKFRSKMTITSGTKKVDLTKLMALMAMGIKKGDKVTIEIEGEDEDEAASYLEDFFKQNL